LEKPHKFHELDGLRGLAALIVVDYHFRTCFGKTYPSHGGLAVDLFFMLSGFVLTYAYQRKLDDGYSTIRFLKARLLRLYPMYFAGLVLGLVLKYFFSDLFQTVPRGELALVLCASLLMLPAPPMAAGSLVSFSFPFNYPMWSLFFELLANVYHGLVLRRRTWKAVAAIAAVSGAMLVWMLGAQGTIEVGWLRKETLLGVPRVIFSYTVGTLLFRVWKRLRYRWRISPMLLGAALVAALMLPWLIAKASGRHVNGSFELVAVTLLFPALLLVGAFSVPSPMMARMCDWLGRISYPLYVVHVPLGDALVAVWPHFRGHAMERDAPWSGLVLVVLAVGVAMALEQLYDGPVRRLLGSKLIGTRG
jgi:peptidoglycan/LPS O-acetylase OafA/YrhL